MTLTSRVAFMVLPLTMTGWLQGQVRMRAGLWENTVIASGQTVTRNACVTPEQEEHSKGTAAAMRESLEKTLAKSGACKLKEFSIAGSTQTMIMVCGNSTMKHVTTFRGDSFETVGTATTAEGVKSSLIKGRRLGDCPPDGAK